MGFRYTQITMDPVRIECYFLGNVNFITAVSRLSKEQKMALAEAALFTK